MWLINLYISLHIHRLWDLGQQRCVHSYAVHTDSVWALASTPTFSHVYSGGRDLSVSTVFSQNSTNANIPLPLSYVLPLFFSFSIWCFLPFFFLYLSLSLFSDLFLQYSSFDAQFCLYSQLYLTDLATRESILLCTKEHPILQLALHDDGIWAATTDSSVRRWPAEGRNPQKVFQRGGSFLAGNLSFSRARASLEGSTPVSHSYSCLFCNS